MIFTDESGLDLDAINDDWSTDSAVYSMESPNQVIWTVLDSYQGYKR